MEWKDPPPTRTVGKYDEVVAELRANPGRWALVSANGSNAAAQSLRAKGCDTRTSSTGDGKVDVYARWPAGKP